jgi:hypothetical protein
VIEAAAVIDQQQIRLMLEQSIGDDFVRRSLIYEPEDENMTS